MNERNITAEQINETIDTIINSTKLIKFTVNNPFSTQTKLRDSIAKKTLRKFITRKSSSAKKSLLPSATLNKATSQYVPQVIFVTTQITAEEAR